VLVLHVLKQEADELAPVLAFCTPGQNMGQITDDGLRKFSFDPILHSRVQVILALLVLALAEVLRVYFEQGV